MMRFLPAALFFGSLALEAQTAIRFLPQSRVFVLEAGPVTYAFGVNDQKELQHLYWGARLHGDADFSPAKAASGWASFDMGAMRTPAELPAWGAGRHYETAWKLVRADGNRDVVLQYVTHRISGDALEVETKDTVDALRATLVYRVYPEGIVRRHARYTNGTGAAVTVESAQSAVWHMPPGEGYRLRYLQGRWAGETQVVEEPIHPGMKVIESRRGNTGQVNPWFAIDGPEPADETHGRVWFGAIGWSGNWRITIEQTPHRQVRVTGGMNSYDFSYHLRPGATLETPPFYAGFSPDGYGEASRRLHRFTRSQVLPAAARPKPRPVLYNSWEATTFQVDEKGQTELARKAASLGVEMFVMDDGWFGARNSDKAGLGDWTVNPKKFPNGLSGLIASVTGLGMRFGLWVEPEMVNPDSDLYRAHPDWVMNFPGRQRTEARNQLILNLARTDVKEHVLGVLDRLLTENPKISFLKWDMNRHVTEPGWPEAPAAEQRHIWVDYPRNLYEILDRLRAKHPTVEIEACSGGGGRIDLGILERVEQVWTSDNTDSLDRIAIQEGFSFAYPAKAMMAWVTDVPNFNGRSTPLEFRFLVAMQGSLGIGNNLNEWKQQDFTLASRMIAWYKGVRGVIQEGELFRLRSLRQGEWSYTQYNAADGKRAAVFALQRSQKLGMEPPAVVLRGLDPKATYRITALDPSRVAEPQLVHTGEYLMNAGVALKLTGDYSGAALVLDRVQ